MRLISILFVVLILAAMSVVVLDAMSGDARGCPPGQTSTTSPVSLPPGLEKALTHC